MPREGWLKRVQMQGISRGAREAYCKYVDRSDEGDDTADEPFSVTL